MSILKPIAAALRRRNWSSRFKQPDGSEIDTGLQELADEIIRACEAQGPFEIDEPLVLNNRTNTHALIINNLGDVTHHGIVVSEPGGTRTEYGIGLGCVNIIAGGVIPQPAAFIDPEIAARRFADTGGRGGEYTLTPDTPSVIPGACPGPGYVADTGFSAGVGSGFGQGQSASGVPEDHGQYAGGGSPQVTLTLNDLLEPVVVRGSLIVGNSVPVWTTLAIGAANRVLRSDGSDPSWGQVVLTTDVTGILPIANGGTGESTALAAFNALSPTTTRGDLITRDASNNVRLAVGAANRVLRSDGTDPSWAQVVLTTDVTGALPIANGGTGQTTATAAFDALGPGTTKGDVIVHNGTDHTRLAVGTDNQVLTADSAQAAGVKWATNAGGDVTGPGSSTDNAVVRFDGTTGKTIQNSGVTIDDNNKLKTVSSHSDINAATDGATITFDLNLSNKHSVTLGGNRTLALSNESSGQVFIIMLKQDATGSRTVTWFSGISWAGGAAPTLTTTANKTDTFGFIRTGASAYLGFVIGLNA